MIKEYPTVGVLGLSSFSYSLVAPALSLGIELRIVDAQISDVRDVASECDFFTVVNSNPALALMRTLENEGIRFRPGSEVIRSVLEYAHFEKNELETKLRQFEIVAARSPHSQACAWSPTEISINAESRRFYIAPPFDLHSNLAIEMQKIALEIGHTLGVIGVFWVRFTLTDESVVATSMGIGPSQSANWTVDASITNQYEQHLRAILDLPLGDPAMSTFQVISANFAGSPNQSMYRPYLHLMARSPRLKMHLYHAPELGFMGHVTITGRDLLDLTESVQHALDYLDGVIDE